jgi:hypothetical protein
MESRKKHTGSMSKLRPGASKEFAAENEHMSTFPGSKVDVSTSNRQVQHAQLEHDKLSASTSYTSSPVENRLSSVAISNEAKFRKREKSAMVLKEVLDEHTMALLQQQNTTAVSPQREAPIQGLSRNLSESFLNLSARNPLKSPLVEKKNEVSKHPGSIDFAPASRPPGRIELGPAPTLENDQMSCFSESEDTMALPQQQNATATSPKRDAPMQRLSRDQSANLLKSPLGKKKNAVSKPPGSIEFAAAPTPEYLLKSPLGEKKSKVSKPLGSKDFAAALTMENDQMANISGSKQTMALEQQQNVTTTSPKMEAPMLRLSRGKSANLVKPPLGNRKNAVSKPPGSIEFAPATAPEYLLKSPLGEKKNEVSKPSGSKAFAAAPTMENDQMVNVSGSEQTIMALEQQQNATTTSPKREAPIRRLSLDLPAVSARNLKKSPRGEKRNAVFKTPGSIEFAGSSDPGERPDVKVSGKKSSCIHVQSTNSQWDRAKLERFTSRREGPRRPGAQRQNAPKVQVMALKQELAEYNLALQQEHNTTAASPQREAPMRRLSRGTQRGVSRHDSECIPEHGMPAEPEPELPQPQRGLTRHYSEQQRSVTRHLSADNQEPRRGVSHHFSERIPERITPSFNQIMALEQQQNATTTSPKREAPRRRLSRDLPVVSTRNLKKSPLEEKKSVVSKTPGSIEFAGSSDPGKPPDVKASGKKSSCIHVQSTNSQWDRAKLERFTSRREVPSRPGAQRQDASKVHWGDLEQICSFNEQKEQDAVSKVPGSIEFGGNKKTGHNLKLAEPAFSRLGFVRSTALLDKADAKH